MNGVKRKTGISPLSSLTQATENMTCLPGLNTHSSVNVSEPESNGGRERRARKSVNYAEPKLNT